MGSRSVELDERSTADGTPEDVAVLYSWANLQGAKYRDYSASRREYRAQVRYRAAKALLERELRAQLDAETSAAQAERASFGAAAETHPESAGLAARVEAARRSEAAARAAVLALREEREIAEAHSSARRQAQVYEEAESRLRQLAGPQPQDDSGAMELNRGAEQGDLRSRIAGNPEPLRFSNWQDMPGSAVERDMSDGPVQFATERLDEGDHTKGSGSDMRREEADAERTAPAWLFQSQTGFRPQVSPAVLQGGRPESQGVDTLLDSRERVAARWFALKGVFDDARPALAAMQPLRAARTEMPALAVFSLAGGVGKTSLAATLGRALSSHGEKVMLADTTSHGLLPIYFGSHEVRRAEINMVVPRAASSAPPVSLVTHDFSRSGEDDSQREMLVEEVLRSCEGNDRLLLDLSTGSDWLIRRLTDLHPTVLVPMAPDMNSVISLQAVERLFQGIATSEGRPLLPFYVLNQFDASLPLHLDIREVFRRQLGDRLLRIAIRRSQAVSEALADGMTVLDYAADAPVSQDYLDVATWLRRVSPPATEELRGLRRGGR